MESRDFKAIYERNYRRSYLFAKSYVHDDMAAEDIAVESLYKYWELLKEGNKEVSEVLLVTIIKNKAIDWLRREMMHQSALQNISDVSMRDLEIRISSLECCNPTAMFSAEIRQIIRRTLNGLSPQTRRIFELSRYETKSVKGIAEITGLGPKAVEYHITKSLKALRIALRDYLPLLLTLSSFSSELQALREIVEEYASV